MLDNKGHRHACRIILESGSQPNLMTEKLEKYLNLKRTKLESSIEAVYIAEVTSTDWVVANIQSKSSNYATKLSFLVLPEITSHTPASPIDKTILNIPKHIRLSDQKFNQPGEVEALIGAEHFYEVLNTFKIPLALPRTALQSTKFGWIVTGKVNSNWNQQRLKHHLVRDNLSSQLDNFWRIEEGEDRRYFSKEEEACENQFSANVQRDSSGKYVVRLPFKEQKEDLGNSYDVAR
ncbi:uncharacterized protein LOC117181469 [Belonocnema kinseyi]|uniref:uncharacterized protein LOC117181469 n=1 Tax=Belonocnema kinseyi TaxID=2817044 RepID=UPI00143DCF95|nr:uncharacterized protein LOC117181469 [Belonocnema kinseyi]